MARPDPAVSLRVPSEPRQRQEGGGDDDRPRLRLVVSRGRLGIELDRPFDIGPVRIDELALALPEVRFPVELSGGAAAFRNKRGQLERVRVTLSSRELARLGERRLEGLLPAPLAHVIVAPLEDGWLVGLAGGEAALVFEVVVAPMGSDLRLLPTAARGLGLGAPPQALAIRALAALTRPLGQRVGGAIVLPQAPREISRRLLPLAGMRAADGAGLVWSEVVADVHAVSLVAEREGVASSVGDRAVSTVELAALVAEAEEALVDGQLGQARRGYLAALTQAPRHPEIARRLAELDLAVGGRAEAALSTLSDAVPVVEAGVLGGQLLSAVGDVEGAKAAWQRAALEEPYGPLAACAWQRLALCTDDPHAACDLLDQAIARAPGLADLRWRRFEQLVQLGRHDQARADLEHLEAAASSAHARHELLRRAADHLLDRRLWDEAAEVFERALRYTPDSVDAVAGLARSLGSLGHRQRALELLSRAVALAERRRRAAPRVTIDLATALAETADDRPAAIARVRSIGPDGPAVFDARLLEARWRAEIGDLAGASVALALLLEAVEASLGVLVGTRDPEPGAAPWGVAVAGEAPHFLSREEARAAVAARCEEAARIHELDRGDLAGARRMLALAVRLAPRSRRIGEAFRRVAGVVDGSVDRAGASDEQRGAPSAVEGLAAPATEAPPPLPVDDEVLVEELSDKVRANPDDLEVVIALADALARLGRDHDLLALVSARIDEGAERERVELGPRRREALRRLLELAQASGNESEASLYALMLQQS